MRLPSGHPIDLTYCTNIHAADGWRAVRANLGRYAPPLKARFSPDAPFGIGLRISAREARELTGGQLQDFRAFLGDEGLYVALINGFPYGAFHGTPVKADVYAPDWRNPARAEYTTDLVRVLAALLPEGMDGGISTAPISYKAWMPAPGAADWSAVVSHIVRVVGAMMHARDEYGARLHLDIEPEPDCVLETIDETVRFFAHTLVPVGAPLLARVADVSQDEAARLLHDHVRVCLDCCHLSVEHEDPDEAIARLQAAGIRVGRVQLSSAIAIDVPADPGEAARATGRLRPFADATYLHQVICRGQDGNTLRHASDLPEALSAAMPGNWRVHFHVPLFAAGFEGLGSTQADVARVIAAVRRTGFTLHLEIETYTWGVLPPALKGDLVDSIAREYEWVLTEWARPHERPDDGPHEAPPDGPHGGPHEAPPDGPHGGPHDGDAA